MDIKELAVNLDLVGVIVFGFIIIYALIALKKKQNLMNLTLLLIGIGGLIVDTYISVSIRIGGN